ncbi:MAG: RHS repeat-associated core domain-containing protein, partial [Dehalococcoidia bacterium]
SLPYLSEEEDYTAPAGTEFIQAEFDDIGRVVKVTKPDTTFRRVVYGKRKSYIIDEKNHAVSSETWGTQIIRKTYTGEYIEDASGLSEYAATTIELRADGTVVTDQLGNTSNTTRDMLGRLLTRNSPDTGLWSYGYDADGNLTSLTDAKAQTITMQYDALDRITGKTYPDAATVQYNYDENGHGFAKGALTSVLYAEGSEWYAYDARGRISSETQTISGAGSQTRSFQYDSLNRLTHQIYPDGEDVTSAYETNGRLTTVSGTDPYITNMDYSLLGQVTRVDYGNGLTANYDYFDQPGEVDATSGTALSQRLRSIHLSNGSYDVLDIDYQYDRAGNAGQRDILIRAEPGSEMMIDENFSYDDLDRLITANSNLYGFKSYSYDEINRITQKNGRNYSYNPARPHAVADDGQFAYTYDNNGNMTNRSDGRTLSWNFDDRLTGVSDSKGTHSFSYNPSGVRLKKKLSTTEGQQTVYYFFDTFEQEYTDGQLTNTIKYYFANGERVAERSTKSGLRYYHKDHLGSLVRKSDDQGNLINILLSTPYGEQVEIGIVPSIPDNETLTEPLVDVTEEHKARDTIEVSTSVEGTSDVSCEAGKKVRLLPGFRTEKGATFKASINYNFRITVISEETRYTFTGKELDATDLYYFGARYYDPGLGTFISSDPAMDGLNWYAYCGNNPMNYVDPWGLNPAISITQAGIDAAKAGFGNYCPLGIIDPNKKDGNGGGPLGGTPAP